MRIKINFSPGNDVSVPIEYNYNIYFNLRKTLLEYLQDTKPKLFGRYKKDFPGLTFSQLMIPEREIETGFIKIYGNFFSLFVGSADDACIEYLAKAISTRKTFPIYTNNFEVKKVEVLDEPEFSSAMRFKMLSPLLLIKVREGSPYFVRPLDPDFNDVFAAHLVKQYNAVYNTQFQASQIQIIPDQEYIERKKNISKLITVRNIHYKAIFCPFLLKGDEALIRFAYHNGIGDKTNYGFGMIEELGT